MGQSASTRVSGYIGAIIHYELTIAGIAAIGRAITFEKIRDDFEIVAQKVLIRVDTAGEQLFLDFADRASEQRFPWRVLVQR